MKLAAPGLGEPTRPRLELVPLASEPTPRLASPPHGQDGALPAGHSQPPGQDSPARSQPEPGSEPLCELWAAHGRALLRFATKLTLGDSHRAEDIVQETLLRAWRHPEITGTGRGRLRPWLFTVARRVAIDMWRARTRDADTTQSPYDPRDSGLPGHPDLPDPTDHIENVITALDVRRGLATLTPAHRAVINELYYNNHSVAETAVILGIPPGTVKSRAHYATRALRHALTHPSATHPAAPPPSQRRLTA